MTLIKSISGVRGIVNDGFDNNPHESGPSHVIGSEGYLLSINETCIDLNGNGTTTFEGPPANVDPSFNDKGLDVYNTELIGTTTLRVYS